jgi:hypothetical protein
VLLLALQLAHPLPLGLDEERLLPPVPPGKPRQHHDDAEEQQRGNTFGEAHAEDDPAPAEDRDATEDPPGVPLFDTASVQVGEDAEQEVGGDPPDGHAFDVQPADQPEDGEHPEAHEADLNRTTRATKTASPDTAAAPSTTVNGNAK